MPPVPTLFAGALRMDQSLDPHVAGHGEGIHLPKPSFTPLIFALGMGLLAFGAIIFFITGGVGDTTKPGGTPWIMLAGLVILLVGVGGWLWGNIRERAHGTETPAVAAKFAMWCFLGTEV